MSRSAIRGRLVSSAVILTVAAGFAMSAGPADAAPLVGGEQGSLLIRATGSTFAGSGGFVAQATTAGGTATYTAKVKNTGSTASQYFVRVASSSNGPCIPDGCPTPTFAVTAGKVDATTTATSPDGYLTPLIAPGGMLKFTIDETLPATAVPGAGFYGGVVLYDTAETELTADSWETGVTATTGTTNHDMFVKAPLGKSTGVVLGVMNVSPPASKLNEVNTYTVKLMNNSAVTTAIDFFTRNDDRCDQAYPYTVRAGTVDVTAATTMLSGYATAPLAPGQSATLKITITTTTLDLTGCYLPYDALTIYSADPLNPTVTGTHELFIDTNPAV